MTARYRLTARFSYRDPMLFYPRARLTDDYLVLTGWHWRGRYRRRISLGRIVHVDVKNEVGLILWLIDGEVIRLSIDEPREWLTQISELSAASAGQDD